MAKEIQDILEEIFRAHLFIEFYYNNNGKLFIFEQSDRQLNEEVLLENYGVFKGCKNLAYQLLDFIKSNKGKKTANFSIKHCPWLEQIKVALNYQNGEAAYIPEDSVFVNDKFKTIYILFNPNFTNTSDGLSLLMHELMHAYQDYQLRLKGLSLENEFKKIGYDKNNTDYSEDFAIKDKRKRELKYNLSWVLYHFNDFERSAYIAQIAGYLHNCKQRFSTINDVFNFLKNTIVYKNYETVFEWTNELINLKDEELQEFVLDKVKELSNYQFKDYAQFVQWLKGKLNRYNNKFNTILPKIANEHLRMIRTLMQPATKSIRRY